MSLPIVGLAGLLKGLSRATNQYPTSEEALPPLDLSALKNLPRESEWPVTGKRGAWKDASEGPAVYPPAVPFNYPNK